MGKSKTILVAPLHWGLGHATRCIPIINLLLKSSFNVIIASDGEALELLQKEFPKLETVRLPSYQISYPKYGSLFKFTMLLKLPIIKKAISSEKNIVKKLVSDGKIQGIISDNRFGVRSDKVPSVYITHQLKVVSGNTTFFSTKAHQKIIKKYDECWVPDAEGIYNVSGELGHLKKTHLPIKYLGFLSRMKKIDLPIKYDVLVLLSGPEPQRSLLEDLLITEFKNSKNSVILVQGIIEREQKIQKLENITSYNFMKSLDLEKAINESNLVVSRSGYSTILDLVTLEKKAFFIPTPGQFEQEYLAARISKLKMAPFCKQKDFKLEKLQEVENFTGLQFENIQLENTKLFSLFEGK